MKTNKVLFRSATAFLLFLAVFTALTVAQQQNDIADAQASSSYELADIFRWTEQDVDLSQAASAVQEQIGEDWRVADWNDLRAVWRFYREDMQIFFEDLGYLHITYNGVSQRGSTGLWHVFADGSGSTRRFFQPTQHLGQQELTLGAWLGHHKVLAIRKDFDPNKLSTQLSANDAVSVDINMDWKLSASIIEVGDSFTLDVRMYDMPQPADHGGISISFPTLDSTNIIENTSTSSNTYNSYEAEVRTVEYTTGLSNVNYYQADTSIWTVYGSAIHAQGLLVETDDPTWPVSADRSIRLLITPKMPGLFTINIRAWACLDGYGDCLRSPAHGTSVDQQGWGAETATVNVIDSDASFSDYFRFTSSEIDPSQAAHLVRQELGSEWRVADWNDLRDAWWLHREEMQAAFEGQGYFHVTRNGDTLPESIEHPYVAVEHPKSGDAVDFEVLDKFIYHDYQLSLTARCDNYKVLAVRKGFAGR